MKTIIWSISHSHAPRSTQVSKSPNALLPPGFFLGMREDEVHCMSGILKSGVHCLEIFKDKDEEREMMHQFSQIFLIMETRDVMDIFALCMPGHFDCMANNIQLLQIVSTLLQAPKILRHFADVLVSFLVRQLDVLKQPDTPASNLALQLFRHLFVAVSKVPDNERVLLPHVSIIMEVCMKNAMEIEKPLAYLQLLNGMFRSLSGGTGKSELLLREFMPSLQPCLNMLLEMVEGPTGENMRDLVLELCLNLPARLSSLLPHLPRLMKPLVLALQGNDELVSLGLRTLEYWIDSLNPDFLEPSMANVMSEVIFALWSHLRPKPYPWGAKALQLLGKLGGRNRRFLREPLALECKENPEHGLRLILTFEPSTPFLVPLDRCIHLAITVVMQKNTPVEIFYRKHTLKLLHMCLSSLLNLRGNISGDGATSRLLTTLLVSPVEPSRRQSETMDTKMHSS